MRNGLLAAAAIALTATTAEALVIHQESFEDAPGAGYTLSDPFDDGFVDFFGRYAVPDGTNAARDDYASGWDGDYGILGQDHDGDLGAATRHVVLAPIDVSGFTALSVTASFGALASEPDFLNFEAAEGDGIKLFATLDAGPQTLVAEFAPPFGGAGDLRLDTDDDGVGDGAVLTTTLADFAFALLGTGSLLTLDFAMTSTGSFETLALDNVRVEGIEAAAVPLPAPGLMLGFGAAALAGLGARRRA